MAGEQIGVKLGLVARAAPKIDRTGSSGDEWGQLFDRSAAVLVGSTASRIAACGVPQFTHP